MSELVEIHDDGSDEEIQTQNNSNQHSTTGQSFDELRTLKREMEFRGSLLGKTWSELSRIMTKYQSQLIHKHEEYESNIGAGEQGRLSQLENVIQKQANDIKKLEKSKTDLEHKLLTKDGEIVRLRTEVHKLRDEASTKTNLISKLQNQMAKEAHEYSMEIHSLKEILEMESGDNSGVGVGGAKRRRMGPRSRVSSRISTFELSLST